MFASDLNRRQFLQRTGALAGLAAAAALPAAADPLGLPVGCQTWPVRDQIARDFPGTLAALSRAGFKSIELCSPVGYSDSGFGGLVKYSGRELRRIIEDHGLTCVSSHFGMDELRTQQPARIAWAHELGLKQMIVPSLDGPEHPTLDDVKRAADEYNGIAARAAAAGIQQGLHNEGFLDTSVGNRRTYDLLFQLLDPRLVKFQFQISSVAYGFDAVTYFTRYPGRFISMHVQGWSAKTRRIVPLGQGTLNWRRIFAAAKIGGIRNYYLEMSLPMMEASLPVLHRLR